MGEESGKGEEDSRKYSQVALDLPKIYIHGKNTSLSHSFHVGSEVYSAKKLDDL